MGALTFLKNIPWEKIFIFLTYAAVAAVGWYGNDMNRDLKEAEWKIATLKQAEAASLELQNKITEIDKTHAEEMKNAKAQINKLRNDIRTGAISLSVPVTGCSGLPQDPSAGAGTAGETRAQLDPKVSEDLIDITEYGDDSIRILTKCQNKLVTIVESVNRYHR